MDSMGNAQLKEHELDKTVPLVLRPSFPVRDRPGDTGPNPDLGAARATPVVGWSRP